MTQHHSGWRAYSPHVTAHLPNSVPVLPHFPCCTQGTSMVVMKGLMASVPPMVMGAFRLLPAGAILVIWAALQGRPQPSGWKAWAWVAAFALVDGAAFQVSGCQSQLLSTPKQQWQCQGVPAAAQYTDRATHKHRRTQTHAGHESELYVCVRVLCVQGFLAEGLTKTPAGLGSVIIDSQPLTVRHTHTHTHTHRCSDRQ